MITYHALVLRQDAPRELLELLRDYLQNEPDGDLTYVFCSAVEVGVQFVEASLLRKIGDEPWKVQIPISFIISIANMSRRAAGPGFLRQT